MNHIIGAYYLIQGTEPQDWMHKDLLPPMLWSASRCICKSLPDSWAFTWTTDEGSVEEKENYQRFLGLSDARFLTLQTYFDSIHNADNFGFPNVFFDLERARLAYDRFFQAVPNVKLISIVLPEIFVDDFIKESTPSPNVGENGIRKKLRQKMIVEEDAQFLGYDLLGYDGANFCSFLCNSLEKDYHTELGIIFNEFGLIQNEKDAFNAAEYTMCPRKAEPYPWHSWRVSEYPLT